MDMDAVEAARQDAISAVRKLKRENAPRISDRAWTSPSGYNYGRWADKGFNLALGLLANTEPDPAESAADFLGRVISLVREQRDEYRVDAADEDGACSGALDAAMWAIIELLPKPPAVSTPAANVPSDPAPDATWTVWYSDLFDREMPPQVEANGTGLIDGLTELWVRFLFETVRPDGSAGFSRFHMQWERGSFMIEGDRSGKARLRRWVFGEKTHTTRGYLDEADVGLLRQVAMTHGVRYGVDVSGQQILRAAADARDRRDFESRLARLRAEAA